MSAQMDLDSPVDVLMTTRGQFASDDPDGPGSFVDAYLSRVPEYPAPRNQQFQAELEVLTLGYMPGSLKGKVPDQIYVFSRGKTPDNPLEMSKVHYTKSLFVVSDKVKRVLETLSIRNSEFYPVSMVYSVKGVNSEDYGGGPVVAGTHWLWWCYSTLDLIDSERTEAALTPMMEPNRALDSSPMVSFHHVGKVQHKLPIKAALKRVPYDECAAFTILGWAAADMIISPALARAFTEAGLIDPEGPVRIGVLPPDGLQYAKINEDFRKGLIHRKPPLRVFGTDIIAADSEDPPFHASRSPYFPLSARNS